MIREILIVVVMLSVTAGAYLLSIKTEVPEAYVFPKTVIVVMVIMAVIQLLESMITAKITAKKNRVSKDPADEIFPWKNVMISLVCVFIYFSSMEFIGFYISGFLFFLITTSLLQKETISLKIMVKRIGIAGVFMTALFLLFHVILAVQTPKGLIM